MGFAQCCSDAGVFLGGPDWCSSMMAGCNLLGCCALQVRKWFQLWWYPKPLCFSVFILFNLTWGLENRIGCYTIWQLRNFMVMIMFILVCFDIDSLEMFDTKIWFLPHIAWDKKRKHLLWPKTLKRGIFSLLLRYWFHYYLFIDICRQFSILNYFSWFLIMSYIHFLTFILCKFIHFSLQWIGLWCWFSIQNCVHQSFSGQVVLFINLSNISQRIKDDVMLSMFS